MWHRLRKRGHGGIARTRAVDHRGQCAWRDERKWREEANVPFHGAFTLRDLGERLSAAVRLEVRPRTAAASLAPAQAFGPRTSLCRHSNQSLSAPRIPAGKKFGDARDWAGIFGDIGRFGTTETVLSPRLLRQSRGKSKTVQTAPGKHFCAGLPGGAGRTQTGNQPIMAVGREADRSSYSPARLVKNHHFFISLITLLFSSQK
jgi:hypothetical protein